MSERKNLPAEVVQSPFEIGIEKGDGEVTAHNVALLLAPHRLEGETWLGYRARLRAARDWRKQNAKGKRLVSATVPEGNIPGRR